MRIILLLNANHGIYVHFTRPSGGANGVVVVVVIAVDNNMLKHAFFALSSTKGPTSSSITRCWQIFAYATRSQAKGICARIISLNINGCVGAYFAFLP